MDRLGNVYSLIDTTTGLADAVYEYDPYGNVLRATGSVAKSNPMGFSTKYTDRESDLVYYGMRYYVPEQGRFLNRDPIGEAGGLNLYAFVGSNPVGGYDFLGLAHNFDSMSVGGETAEKYVGNSLEEVIERLSNTGMADPMFSIAYRGHVFQIKNYGYQTTISNKLSSDVNAVGEMLPLEKFKEEKGRKVKAQGRDGGSHNFNDPTVAAANHGPQLWFSGLFESRMSIITQEIIYPSGADLNSVADSLYVSVRNFAGFNEATDFYLVN